ncbi:MAG TPA: hypothetical protein PLZ45_08725 [Ferruginibacter sp.]|nr:hypothetical protein [Chitinophagaceae bacterium]HRI24748.1 hypothetical protein [Ferruginibacter sp.]
MKRNNILIALSLISVMLFSTANAADTAYGVTSLPVELKYAGNYNNQPLIQLNFNGTKEENLFRITVTDQAGVILYNGNVKGENFSKQFLLNTDDLGDAVLTFEITGAKSGKSVSYQVSRQKKTTEQMNVVKL